MEVKFSDYFRKWWLEWLRSRQGQPYNRVEGERVAKQIEQEWEALDDC